MDLFSWRKRKENEHKAKKHVFLKGSLKKVFKRENFPQQIVNYMIKLPKLKQCSLVEK